VDALRKYSEGGGAMMNKIAFAELDLICVGFVRHSPLGVSV
jgi:hypothetical protein